MEAAKEQKTNLLSSTSEVTAAVAAPAGAEEAARRGGCGTSRTRRVVRCALSCALLYPVVVYAGLGVLLALPSAQALLVCLHTAKYVLRADYTSPAKVFVLGARDVRLRVPARPTAGGGAPLEAVELGMWHVLPAGAPGALAAGANAAAGGERARTAVAKFDAALRAPDGGVVVLFLHGNGEHRAAQQGPIHARAISAALRSHVLMLDYRGFGDSSGWPSEEGLAADAHAAWLWLTAERGVAPSRVLLWGHSLGSAVAARLAAELADAARASTLARGRAAGAPAALPLGLVLESAFTSIRELLPDYPLGRAVCWLPGVRAAAAAGLAFRMDSRARVAELARAAPQLPLLLLHGTVDATVPAAHSRALLDAARAAGAQRASLVELPSADHHTVLASDEALLAVARLIGRASGGEGAQLSAGAEPAHALPARAARRAGGRN
ncbi:hypothetical protein KFE25_010745 [Diacronema lutheri]|uniref:AB hydrolase-1 domain-containing protein n=1 Tax=Diacronema lutheri TaxID=2081491 RepID=A0A8J5XBD3_DIALT|nr:hypothetical protein KFE25_010745 [Diacronema lutheri]